jgi:uncharacterized protein (DUF1015 family)
MADVHPFKGLRYNSKRVPDLGAVVSPPYDVISADFQEILYNRNPHNIVRLEFGKEPVDMKSGSNRYIVANELLSQWRQTGVLNMDSEPSLYLLKEVYSDNHGVMRIRYSLFARVRLEEFSKGVVLPHEETRQTAKRDRLELLSASKANLSPIMGLYRDSSGVIKEILEQAMLNPPLSVVEKVDGQDFTLWDLSEPTQIEAIHQALLPLPIYLADGHHRYETAITYRDMQGELPGDAAYVMMGLIDLGDPGLHLEGYHRVLSNLNSTAEETLEHQLGEFYQEIATIELPESPDDAVLQMLEGLSETQRDRDVIGVVDLEGKRFRIMMLSDQGRDLLAKANNSIPELIQCDAWTLQEGVLNQVVNSDSAVQLEYVHDAADAVQNIRSHEAHVLIMLLPMPLDLFESVVIQGVRLPPKSTYFSPKLPTGFVVYMLE